MSIPFQAIECYMTSVIPLHGKLHLVPAYTQPLNLSGYVLLHSSFFVSDKMKNASVAFSAFETVG